MSDAIVPLGPAWPAAPAAGGRALLWSAVGHAAAPRAFAAAVASPCASCGLLPDGLRDPVVRGVHFCGRRGRALDAGLRPAVPAAALASRAALEALPPGAWSALGRLGSAYRARADGFARVGWDEVADRVTEARRPIWVPGAGLSLEVRLAAQAVFGGSPWPAAARHLAARTGSALGSAPLPALRRASWVWIACARGVDPTDERPVLARWLSAARGRVTALGPAVSGVEERVVCPGDLVPDVLAAVADPARPAPPGLDGWVEELRRRRAGGPGFVLAHGDDEALADAVLAVAAGHGYAFAWEILPPPFDLGSPPEDPDLWILHGEPPVDGPVAERLRAGAPRVQLLANPHPSLAWPGPVDVLPARPPWEQDGVSFVGLDRRVRGADPWLGEPIGESRADWELLRFLAAARGRDLPAPTPRALREATARSDRRYAGWETVRRAGDHVRLAAGATGG